MVAELAMTKRRWNWPLWAGFLLCLLAVPGYFLIFDKYPVTRDIPWVTFLMFGAGVVFLVVGLRRSFQQSLEYRGKIFGPILGILSVLIIGLFSFMVFHLTRELPASAGAPRIGQKAPEFVLPDTNNTPVSLSSLLSTPLAGRQTPPRGVVLVFYRGYW